MRLSFLLSIWYVLYLHENIFALGLVYKYLRAQFRKILIINLPSRTDHRDAMSLSAAVSNLQLDWIDDVSGDDVLEKALSPRDHKFISRSAIKVAGELIWMPFKRQYFPNSKSAFITITLLSIVEQNLTTALILEDDVDWDTRLKS